MAGLLGADLRDFHCTSKEAADAFKAGYVDGLAAAEDRKHRRSYRQPDPSGRRPPPRRSHAPDIDDHLYGSERTPSVEIGIEYPRWQILTGSVTSSFAQQDRHPDDSGSPAQHRTLPSPRPSASGSQPAASPQPSSTRRGDSVGRQSDVSAKSSTRPPPSFISDQWRSRS